MLRIFRRRRTWMIILLALIILPIIAFKVIEASFVISTAEMTDYFKQKPQQPNFVTYTALNHEMFYAETGSDTNQLVLFVHGAPGSWDAFMKYLGDTALMHRAQLVSVDRPGYGKSGMGQSVTSIEAQAAMRQTAGEKNAVICGSLMMKEGDKFYNRLIWMRPDGSCEQYDKRHLFGLGEEHEHYDAGAKKIIVGLNGWKLLPLICYDLRFPVWARNTEEYDVLLYVANWPERRINAWKTLLEARAIENQCYVIGVNRVGNDAHGIYYPGESSLIDPKGEVFIRESHYEQTHTFSLSYHHLHHIRETLPFLKDRDTFKILY